MEVIGDTLRMTQVERMLMYIILIVAAVQATFLRRLTICVWLEHYRSEFISGYKSI